MIEHLTFYERSLRKESLKWRRKPGLSGGVVATNGRSHALFRFTIAAILCAALSGCHEQILHDLSETEANKVMSRLSASGASAEKVLQSDGRWAIAVPRDKVLAALSFLDSHRVLSVRDGDPKPKSQSGIVPSREEQWFRYERSLAKTIEESLSTMQGVLEARVHLHLPESDPLFGTRHDDRGSGSVLVVIDARFQAKDEELAALVAGAVGIAPMSVRVLRSTAPAADEGKALQAAAEEAGFKPDRETAELSVSSNPQGSAGLPSSPARGVQVGLASMAGIAAVMIAGLWMRRRKPKVTFALPISGHEES